MKSLVVMACGLLGSLASTFVQGQANYATNQLTNSALSEQQQRSLFAGYDGSFLQSITAPSVPENFILDNAAGRLVLADKTVFPFLATLPNRGISTVYAALKACGLLNVHTHPRGSEAHLVLSGQMTAGIAEEFGGPQNLTFKVNPGQNMVVPQGLWHYNFNDNCSPLVFLLAYDSADPGNIGITATLSGLTAGNPQVAAAGGFTTAPNDLVSFALDQTCLKTCGLPSTGAPGNGYSGLSQELQVLLGVAEADSPTAGPNTGPGPSTG